MSTNFYELTYIINPVLEDEQFSATVEKINSLVEKHGGEVEEVDEWGLRQFAFEMDKKGSGYYVNMYFTAPGDAIAKIERTMKIDDEILRYLSLKYDAKMMRHRELQKNNAVPNIFEVENDEENSEEDDD